MKITPAIVTFNRSQPIDDRWFAGKQIRNVAAVGGNIMTGSPISDLNPIFMAAGCNLAVASLNADTGSIFNRTVQMDHTFFTGYRKNVLRPEEVLVSLTVPFTEAGEHFFAYKQARRREDDIAIVNAAFRFKVGDEGLVQDAVMAFGGMAPVTKMPLKTMEMMRGQKWEKSLIEKAMDQLLLDLPLPPGVPGAMVRYRSSLTLSLFFKAFLAVSEESGLVPVDKTSLSAVREPQREPTRGHQFYEVREDGSKPVGQPLKHRSAEKQATGEAVYVDDLPAMKDELYLGFVLSQRAHAEIVSVDYSGAETVEGFVGVVDGNDVACNEFNVAIRRDEKLFAEGKVECVGQVGMFSVAARHPTESSVFTTYRCFLSKCKT